MVEILVNVTSVPRTSPLITINVIKITFLLELYLKYDVSDQSSIS